MPYMLTTKKDGKVLKQGIFSETSTLNLLRRVILSLHRMEETSADLRAIRMLNDVVPGKAVGMDVANGMRLIVQVYKES